MASGQLRPLILVSQYRCGLAVRGWLPKPPKNLAFRSPGHKVPTINDWPPYLAPQRHLVASGKAQPLLSALWAEARAAVPPTGPQARPSGPERWDDCLLQRLPTRQSLDARSSQEGCVNLGSVKFLAILAPLGPFIRRILDVKWGRERQGLATRLLEEDRDNENRVL